MFTQIINRRTKVSLELKLFQLHFIKKKNSFQYFSQLRNLKQVLNTGKLDLLSLNCYLSFHLSPVVFLYLVKSVFSLYVEKDKIYGYTNYGSNCFGECINFYPHCSFRVQFNKTFDWRKFNSTSELIIKIKCIKKLYQLEFLFKNY